MSFLGTILTALEQGDSLKYIEAVKQTKINIQNFNPMINIRFFKGLI